MSAKKTTIPPVKVALRRACRLGRGGLWLVLAVATGCSDAPPPPPEQPIAFNHQKHAENDVPCTRCHVGVETQASAALPPMSVCAFCHRRRFAVDHPEVQKLMEAYDAGEQLVWRKVNTWPASGMVHFKHKPHVRAEIDCATCHGDVTQMTVAQRVINTADMGWCVECHRDRGASTDCLTCHY